MSRYGTRAGSTAETQPSLSVGAEELAAQLELAQDAIFARDAKRQITFWNRGAQETYGYTRREAVGRMPHELLRTEYPVALEEIERIVTEEGGWEGDLVQHDKDGRRMVVESRWAARYASDGSLAGVLEVNRDISRRFASQAAMLEQAPDAFVGVGRDGLIVLANSKVEALFGYSRGELLAQPVEMLMPEPLRRTHAEHRAGYFHDPRARPMGAGLELRGRRHDGSEFPAEISLSSVQAGDGLIALAAIRDITERVAEGRERERMRGEADRARLQHQVHETHRLESLGQLAGGIAHDFNNLLAVIINYTAFVASDVERATAVDGQQRWKGTREDLDQIRLAGERAAQLTHQLLAFARREVVRPEVIDVNAVVQDVEQLLRRTLGEHIDLQSVLAEDLCAVLIDPGRLEQILVNLAVNARDAMPDGGLLQIDTSNMVVDEEYAATRPELSPGPHVRLRVSDSGSGMPPEILERVFDPFFTTKPPGQGTGLGLATVYGIVQQAGGRAQIYSEPNLGTTFTALLPATTEPPSTAARAPQRRRAAGGETILLVEDEQALRDVTERILRGGGYTVLTAANGPDALARAASIQTIDLLLTDVIMPQMSGPQLAERLRGTRSALRVLFMSGFAQPILDSARALHDGVTLIEKPFSADALLAKIDQVLCR
jgi:PAS domain S-box-containing protein